MSLMETYEVKHNHSLSASDKISFLNKYGQLH